MLNGLKSSPLIMLYENLEYGNNLVLRWVKSGTFNKMALSLGLYGIMWVCIKLSRGEICVSNFRAPWNCCSFGN